MVAFLLLHWSKRIYVSAWERLVKSTPLPVPRCKIVRRVVPSSGLSCAGGGNRDRGYRDVGMRQPCVRIRTQGGRKYSAPIKYWLRRCFGWS